MSPEDPFVQGMRRRTLAQLRVNPNAAADWNPSVPRSVNSEAAGRWRPPDYQPPAQPAQDSQPPQDTFTQLRQQAQEQPPVNLPPDESSFSEAMSHANPLPGWAQQGLATVNQPFSMPTTGGSPMSLSDMVQIPENKWEAGALVAGALPGGKILKSGRQALKLGTAALEGAAPEVGALSKALAGSEGAAGDVLSQLPSRAAQLNALTAAPEAGLTADQVLAAAAQKKKLGYADWERKTPDAGEGMFDYENAEPAPIGAERGQLPRYDPKRGTSARMADAINNPKVAAAMKQAVEDGGKVLPENWYRTGPLYKTFESVLGSDRAPAAYERLMQFVAGTSPRSRVPDNLRTASYYYYLDRNNLPLPAKPAAGYGSVAQKLHLQNITNIQEQGGLNPLQNPKPASFSENLLGNESVLTSDTHNFRFIGMASEDPRFLANSAQIQVGETAKGKPIYNTIKPRQMYADGKLTMEEALQNPTYWDSAPAKNEYKAVEDHQRGLAQEMNLPLADFQGKMWVGGGFPSENRSWHTGLGSPPESFLRTFGKRVQYTAARLGVKPEEVLHKFVLGEIPMLGAAGAAVAGAGLTLPGQQPPASDQEPQQ